jgi:hypothetical protein
MLKITFLLDLNLRFSVAGILVLRLAVLVVAVLRVLLLRVIPLGGGSLGAVLALVFALIIEHGQEIFNRDSFV